MNRILSQIGGSMATYVIVDDERLMADSGDTVRVLQEKYGTDAFILIRNKNNLEKEFHRENSDVMNVSVGPYLVWYSLVEIEQTASRFSSACR